MPQGSRANSKANLSAAQKNAKRKQFAGDARPDLGTAASKASRAENAKVHDLFAEGNELHGLTVLAGLGGQTLAEMMKRERREKELDPAVSARIEALRKLIGNILELRAQVSSDAPLMLLADELAKRIATMRTDESSPPPPDAED